MSADLPLFAWQERYPGAPGFKRHETSAEAAASVGETARGLRLAVLAALRRHGPLTADEIAGALGESVLTIRPRVSELVAMGLVVKTGLRRRNDSGRTAIVWRRA